MNAAKDNRFYRQSSPDLTTIEQKRTLIYWLEERRDNCIRLAKLKTGRDARGWLEDAEHFNMSVHVIKATL